MGKIQALALVDLPVLLMCRVRCSVFAMVPSSGRLKFADDVLYRMLGTPVDDVNHFYLSSFTDSKQACAYVIASDLGGGAACKFDYCSMFF